MGSASFLDIDILLRVLNQNIFHNKIRNIQWEWGESMGRCTGLCLEETRNSEIFSVIFLNKCLLRRRSRKELIETLLHMMIHAYCVMQKIHEPNGGHGVIFLKIMESINQSAGMNISIFHSLGDMVKEETPSKDVPEVEKQEVWSQIDEDICIQEPNISVVDLVDSSEEQMEVEMPIRIKQETGLADHHFVNDTIVEMISGKYEISDQSAENPVLKSVIEDLFGKDSFMHVFERSNSDSGNTDYSKEIISCPVCRESMVRDELPHHIDSDCSGFKEDVSVIVIDDDDDQDMPLPMASSANVEGVSIPDPRCFSSQDPRSPCPVCSSLIVPTEMVDHVEACLTYYSEEN